jgi:4-hydroxy-3-polyprenylbenzoate decarboxylase
MPKRFSYDSLRDFIAHLEISGELIRITEPVSPILEITEIADRVSKSPGGGKALLFEKVEGSTMPVLINAFGSVRRMAAALGTDDLDAIGADIQTLIDQKPPETWGEKLAMLGTLFRVGKFPPKVVNGEAPCQEVIRTGADVDLDLLPVLKCWPDDGGRFVTLPCVFTKSPDGRHRNVGMYRMQIFNPRSTGMHWHIHKDGAGFYHEYTKLNRRMEVAVAVGCDPAVVYAATAPLPPGIDELMLAGFLRDKPVELVKCRTVDLEVPRTAEIVIEGYVDPGDLRIEGPFGDHTGYYSLQGDYPVFHVTAITHRKEPIYLTTIVGKPPMEDCFMGKATERIFLPLLKTVNPEIVDYDLPWEGVFHNCVIVSFEKRYPAQARKLMSGLWGAGQMAFAKMLLMVDDDVDVHDYDAVARRLLDRLDIANDLILNEGVLDVLDHSAPTALYGAKLGVDATTPMGGESRAVVENRGARDFAPFEAAVAANPKIVGCSIPYRDVNGPLAIVAVEKTAAGDGHKYGREAAAADTGEAIRIVLVVDAHVDASDWSVALWKFFNNVDPRRDMLVENGRLIIDATKKLVAEGHPREWPDELVMSSDIVAKVDEKWSRLGIR